MVRTRNAALPFELLIHCLFSHICAAMGTAHTVQLNRTMSPNIANNSRSSLTSPAVLKDCKESPSQEKIICNTNNTDLIECVTDQLYNTLPHGEVWVNICTFQVPENIVDFANYRCSVKPHSGNVHCITSGRRPVPSYCVFTLFHTRKVELAEWHHQYVKAHEGTFSTVYCY